MFLSIYLSDYKGCPPNHLRSVSKDFLISLPYLPYMYIDRDVYASSADEAAT